MNIKAEILKYLPNLKKIREDIYDHPEASFKEYRTTKIIRDFCMGLGLTIIETGMDTGVTAFLQKGDKPSKSSVALRADIDAVNINNEPRHLCGHDYHTVSLMGCAQFLSEHRNMLKRDVVFIFQPAEELTQGANEMLKHGIMQKLPTVPERLFGIHNRPEIPVGCVRVQEGALMAVKSNFVITVKGKTGHGGSPHQCIDPIIASAAVINAVQSIVSRNIDPTEPCVCTICSVHSGTRENFAPESAVMTGSVRALDNGVHDLCLSRLEEINKGIALAYNCEIDMQVFFEVPLVYNSPEMTSLAMLAASRAVGENNIVQTKPCLGSEDFAVLGKNIPYFFYWVGAGSLNKESAPWHSNDFCIAEGYLEAAIALLIESALLD